jgi:catechol 2,3-dioxygenase-like lactoylglutathione lyase family enzyme
MLPGMNPKDVYPLFVVPDPLAVRDWYVRHLGFTVAFEVDWVVYLASPGERRFGLCFMRHGLDHQLPQFRRPLTGHAALVTIEVEDAEDALREVEATGATPAVPLRDEPWGQRHFMLRDPAGIWVDIAQQTDPDPKFLPQTAREQLAAALDDRGG